MEECQGLIRIGNAVTTGRNYRVEVPWAKADRSQIGHFHPAPAELEKYRINDRNKPIHTEV